MSAFSFVLLMQSAFFVFAQYNYSTNILWGNYLRPSWAGNVTFTINKHTNQVTNVHGIVVPISSRGRGNVPLAYNAKFMNNKERSHLFGLSNGGPDISQNVVLQPNDWHINGGWADLQQTIHNITVLAYEWNGCMCPDEGTYTVETVFNSTAPTDLIYYSVNVEDYDINGYPYHYSGFLANGTGVISYNFKIAENQTAWWSLKPPLHLACNHGGSSCCNRWNCCDQQQIEQVFANNMNISNEFGTIIYENDTMNSNNGLYEMKLESTGNIAIYYTSSNEIIWRSNTSDGVEYSPHKFIISSNGSMYLKNNKDDITIITGACGNSYSFDKPFRFIMENNGNLVLYDFSNHICWSSDTILNTTYNNKQSFICSSNVLINQGIKDNTSYFLSNDSCIADISVDGQFVIKDLTKGDNNIVWSTNTTNIASAPYQLALQMDGRVVLSGNNKLMWQVTSSFALNISTMQNFMLMLHRQKRNCVLNFYDNQMRVIWSSLQ